MEYRVGGSWRRCGKDRDMRWGLRLIGQRWCWVR